ncbi:MAG: hypothetical protein KAY37_07010 [Phycisphaerae bacterium]|nr:hypothetical protein [Phycisphaerae bacterium]
MKNAHSITIVVLLSLVGLASAEYRIWFTPAPTDNSLGLTNGYYPDGSPYLIDNPSTAIVSDDFPPGPPDYSNNQDVYSGDYVVENFPQYMTDGYDSQDCDNPLVVDPCGTWVYIWGQFFGESTGARLDTARLRFIDCATGELAECLDPIWYKVDNMAFPLGSKRWDGVSTELDNYSYFRQMDQCLVAVTAYGIKNEGSTHGNWNLYSGGSQDGDGGRIALLGAVRCKASACDATYTIEVPADANGDPHFLISNVPTWPTIGAFQCVPGPSVEDLYPPSWRGDPLTVLAEWDFSYDFTPYPMDIPPEYLDVVGDGVHDLGTAYTHTHADSNVYWQPDPSDPSDGRAYTTGNEGLMEFFLVNWIDDYWNKYICVHITYGGNGTPWVDEVVAPPWEDPYYGVHLETIDLCPARVEYWVLHPNPNREFVNIKIPPNSWVDKVVIDTISTYESMLLNDDCVNALPIGDVTNLRFNTVEATFDGNGTCMVSPNIWYCYTATCTGTATTSLCGSGFDTMLAVYDGCSCDPLGTELCCNDNYCGLQSLCVVPVVQGQEYLIEVGGYADYVGAGVLSISCTPDSGACCDDYTGICEDDIEAHNCQPPLRFAADTYCVDLDPPCGIIGACCFPDGSCVDLVENDCDTQGGDWQGQGTDCATFNCPQPPGACCFTDGSCVDLTEDDCLIQGGDWYEGEECISFVCPGLYVLYDSLCIVDECQYNAAVDNICGGEDVFGLAIDVQAADDFMLTEDALITAVTADYLQVYGDWPLMVCVQFYAMAADCSTLDEYPTASEFSTDLTYDIFTDCMFGYFGNRITAHINVVLPAGRWAVCIQPVMPDYSYIVTAADGINTCGGDNTCDMWIRDGLDKNDCCDGEPYFGYSNWTPVFDVAGWTGTVSMRIEGMLGTFGACCLPDDSCEILTDEGCAAHGGVFQGDYTDCSWCEDCNTNGIPDPQDLIDCDGSPWCEDCNTNGLLDECDLAAGTSADTNSNGIPDECETCRGDANCDGQINWRDIDYFVAAMNNNIWQWEQMFLPGTPSCPFANNDVNADGNVTWRDIDAFVGLMNTTCP